MMKMRRLSLVVSILLVASGVGTVPFAAVASDGVGAVGSVDNAVVAPFAGGLGRGDAVNLSLRTQRIDVQDSMLVAGSRDRLLWRVDLATGRTELPVDFDGPGQTLCAAASNDGVSYVFVTRGGAGHVARVAADGTTSVYAGGGTSHVDGVPAVEAYLTPTDGCAMDVDDSGRLFLAVRHAQFERGYVIRMVDPADGTIWTVAGGGTSTGDDVAADDLLLQSARELHVAADGAIYVSWTASDDRGWTASVVRRIADGRAARVVGSGVGGDPVEGDAAFTTKLSTVTALTTDADGALTLVDRSGVWRVLGGVMTSLGDAAGATGVAVDGDRILVASRPLHRVTVFTPDGIGGTVLGNGYSDSWGGDGAAAVDAQIGSPIGLSIAPDGSVYVANGRSWEPQTDSRLRRILPDGVITTVAGGAAGWWWHPPADGEAAIGARLDGLRSTATGPDGTTYLAGRFGVYRMTDDGHLRLVVPSSEAPSEPPDGVPATESVVRTSVHLAVTHDGDLLISDLVARRIRRVDAVTGIITTFAGTGDTTNSGDGGPATQAGIREPRHITVAHDGAVLVATPTTVRRITPDGIITTVAGTGAAGRTGDGGPATAATFDQISALAAAPDGSIFVTQGFTGPTNLVARAGVIRRIDPYGIVTRFAGDYTHGDSGDGGHPTDARFRDVDSLAITADGSLLVADAGANRIRVIRNIPPAPVPPPPPDTTPPAAVMQFKAHGAEQQVSLAWTLPADPDLARVVVRRGTGFVPHSPTDGAPVYEGLGTSVTLTNMANWEEHWFSAFAIDAAGNAAAPAITWGRAVPATKTSVLLEASGRSILHGQGVTLRGQVVRTGTEDGVTKRSVTFQVRSTGTATWSNLRTATTDGNGRFAFAHKPPVNQEYRVVHTGDVHYRAAASPRRSVTVRPVVTGSTTRPTLLLGRSASITGRVTPAHAGAAVTLQRYVDGAWRNVTTTTLSSRSTYRFTVTPGTSSRHSHRVILPAHADHGTGVSPTVTIRVHRMSIGGLVVDAVGDDRYNLNGETVTIENTGRVQVDLAGWKLHAAGRDVTHTLPKYLLAAGRRVTIHSGTGTSGNGHIYLGRTSPLWVDKGDTARLFDLNGHVVAKRSR